MGNVVIKINHFIGKNRAISYLLSKLVTASLGLVVLMLLTRSLSGVQYGEYVLIFSYFTLLNGIFTYWIPVCIFRFFSSIKASKKLRYRLIFKGAIPSVLLLMLCFFLAQRIVYSELINTQLSITLSVLALITLFFASTLKFLVASMLTQQYMLVTMARSLSYVLFLFIALSISSNNIVIFVSLGASYLVSLGVFYKLYVSDRKNTITINEDSSNETVSINTMLRYGVPLTISYLSSQALIYTDRWIISALEGVAEAGKYSAGMELTVFCVMAGFTALNMSHYPKIIASYDKDADEFKKNIAKVFPKYYIYIVCVFIAFQFLADGYISLLIGEEYRDSFIEYNKYYLLIGFFQSLLMFYFNYTYQLSKKTFLQAITYFGMLIVNVFLGWYMVGLLGVKGAAISTVLVMFFAIIIAFNQSKRLIGVSLYELYFKKMSFFVPLIVVSSFISQWLIYAWLIVLYVVIQKESRSYE